MKAESFECRDARIRTHTLEFRNQTWSVRVVYFARLLTNLS